MITQTDALHISLRNELISYGAGVNSTAMIILLVNKGWRGPIVFSDTGAEWPETYCFIDYFENEWLKPRGLEVVRLGGVWRRGKEAMPLIDYCEDYRICPMAAYRWCTEKWKRKPLDRFAESLGGGKYLVGIAADEWRRAKGLKYPLLDAGITRQDCIKLIEAEGLNVPQKSGCYICPFQRKPQWYELWQRHPKLFERAAKLEELSTERRGEASHLRPGGEWTLREIEREFESQIPMFDDAIMDRLQAYKPCICGL